MATKVLSYALIGKGQYKEALPILEDLARKQPHDPEVQNNLGIALSVLMRWAESIECFKRALSIAPKDPEILKNLGAAYADQKQWNEAVPWLLKAIEHYPGDYVEAVSLLGACLMNADRIDEAIACYKELWAADSQDVASLYQLIFGSLRYCEWQNLGDWLGLLRERSVGLTRPLDSPFAALSFPGFNGGDYKRIAETHARNVISPYVYKAGTEWRAPEVQTGKRRLKIGYLSADFRYHPVGFIIPELIERHNRDRVEVTAYSIGVDDNSEIRARLKRAFDRFVDLKADSIPQMIERIRQDNIDILVDLQGWTSDARPELLALRCAKTHVNWLGYAGTMGHPQLADYIIGDPIVTPLDHAGHFSESIAQLPHSYLPADTTRKLQPPPSRTDQGLPEDGFVFCSLNNSYKFNPGNFDVWCRLLREVAGSVLWLSRPNENAVTNLRKEAARRGIEPGRLLFARRVESPTDHLARIQIADLALDTFPYNSHSSGVDTLWAGVPMVTLVGDSFAGRVGASLLKAAGLDELVTTNIETYFDTALMLARNPQMLSSLRNRLTASRETSPLFDMAQFASAMEDIFEQMSKNARSGSVAAIPAV